ncbi:hypothetical protein OG883_44655 [Streptomyces sp. NBC_01142]|uniref:hypothetical protein n=1 Tax=Streptomyces sp. NBC_01142 TaxID=2975865 RepID=UPI00225876D3|nr:hypothetical protein [Streptomyces sp. NBC_01142]MCX4826737.1 hypothetical protein [Streptomyces sp. NBC_01142]
MNTRTFTVEELRAVGVPHDLPEHAAVADFHVSNGCWAETRRCVFRHEGAFWAVDYDQPLTEQGVVDHGWDRSVEATRVVSARVPTTMWVPADAGVEAEPAVDAWIAEVRHPATGRFRFSYRDDEYELAKERVHERRRHSPEAEVRLVRMTITYTVVSPD